MADTNVKRDFVDPKVLGRLMGLPLHARHPMLGAVSGRHRSPIRGSSLEFAEYRKYVPGDDLRRLDWRAWGRSDRYYIKEFEADTNLRMCLIVDTSGSMNFGEETGNHISKLEYARRLAGTLAYLAANQGDACGVYCAGTEFHSEIPPKRGAIHLGVVLDKLAEMEADGETGLADSIHEAAEKISQRALVIIISDLFVPPQDLKSGFQHLRFRKHDVAVFHLIDQNEIDFEFDRPTRFIDLEGGAPLLADPTLIANQYRKAVKGYLEEVDTLVRDAEIDYHRVGLAEPYDNVLARFLLGRTPKTKK
ncbi:MAG: DUF58 domain-containing protein [Verrucomicrobiales bacterium]|nr:DUF58 domain-containing protein [Verrucomicrobiales bacterium]